MRLIFDDNENSGKTEVFYLNDRWKLPLVWCASGAVDGYVMKNFSQTTEEEQYSIDIQKGFWVGSQLVTQELWKYIMGSHPRLYDVGTNLPAEGVSLSEAREFCSKLTQIMHNKDFLDTNHKVDLPTEAQWEYACRSGTTSVWFFGNNEAILDEFAWYMQNSEDKKHTIATKKPNKWGIFDIYGNVMEWCQSQEIVANGSFVRGGSFLDLAGQCTSTYRYYVLDNNPLNESTGLRIVINSN